METIFRIDNETEQFGDLGNYTDSMSDFEDK